MTSLLARLIADLNGTLHFAQILFYTLSVMLSWLYLRPQNFVKHIFLRDLLVELFLTKQRHSGNRTFTAVHLAVLKLNNTVLRLAWHSFRVVFKINILRIVVCLTILVKLLRAILATYFFECLLLRTRSTSWGGVECMLFLCNMSN